MSSVRDNQIVPDQSLIESRSEKDVVPALARECARQARLVNQGPDEERVMREIEELSDYRGWR
jgi:hypothetical protein